MTGTLGGLDALLGESERLLAGMPALSSVPAVLRARLDEPLRVAIVGRLKAGKSTVLNALVGERLAATDASECTRVVTWYRFGAGYEVTAVGAGGERVPVAFERSDRGLAVRADDLGGIDHLDVRWPTAALRRITLVDTPGLLSSTDGVSARTAALLHLDDGGPAEADVVIHLVRHLHRDDLAVLEAFTDGAVGSSSPAASFAVLSRADEVGGGRLDALDAAAAVAARLAADERVRPFCLGVVPVAGLLAEAAVTFTEDDAAVVRALAADADIDSLLLSVDRFRRPGDGAVSPERRADLLDRLGLYGVRCCVDAVRRGSAGTAVVLAGLLRERSGIDALRTVVDELFLPRARVLKAVAVLGALRSAAASAATTDPVAARGLREAIERAEATSQPLAELRLAHRARAGLLQLRAHEVDEAVRLTGAGGARERLGVAPEAAPEELRAAALAGVERWRARAEQGALDPESTEAARVVTRLYEQLYLAAG